MQKLYTEVRAEEEKAREVRDREAGGNVEAPPRQSQASEALKIGGLAHGVISRLLTTLKLMHEVCKIPRAAKPLRASDFSIL